MSALKVCVKEGWLPVEAMTTATILETVSKWYRIMSARTIFEGLRKIDPSGKSRERLIFLKEEFIPLLQQLVPINSAKLFLPAMASALICTKAVLTVYEEQVEKGIKICGFNFKMLFKYQSGLILINK